MAKTYNPTENDTWEVVYPDDRGPVIIRKRRPWPVPLPVMWRWTEDDLYEEDEAA